jgi:hypothetical protein
VRERVLLSVLEIIVGEELGLSHIDLIWTPPFKAVSRNLLRPFRRAARALLRSLQDSRARAARKIIHDYRHLLQE